jgi:DNA-binding transcriptional LysR family regulator
MDRLQAMETSVRVVETGSFSAAARDLRVGQPAVSKIIATLESRLGVRLLVRSTRRLQPTEAGQAFHERARRVIDEADWLIDRKAHEPAKQQVVLKLLDQHPLAANRIEHLHHSEDGEARDIDDTSPVLATRR